MQQLKKRLGNALVIDIASDSVVGSIVNFADAHASGPIPTPILSVRSDIAFQDGEAPEKVISDILDAIDRTVSQLQKGMLDQRLTDRRHVPRRAFCIVHSPLLLSQTKVIRTTLPKPAFISRRLIESLIKTEADSDIKAAPGLAMLESRVLAVELNGYHTDAPYGKRANEIGIMMHESLIGEKVLEDIKARIRARYQIPIEFHSVALVYFSAIQDLHPHAPHDLQDESFLIISIDSLTTDVHVVKKGILVQTISFPIGKNFFIKKVTDILKVLPPIAASKMRMYVDGTTTGESDKLLEPILYGASKEWQKQFADTLANASQELFIPRLIYLKADPEMLPYFKKMITEQDFRQFSTAKQPFTVIADEEDSAIAFINKVHNA